MNGGDAELFLNTDNLASHSSPQVGIKIGQWFIKQKQIGFADDSSSQRDTLPLSARELTRFVLQLFTQAKHPGRLFNTVGYLGLADTGHFQREGQILCHRHMRIEGIVLKNHSYIAIARAQMVHPPRTNIYLAAVRFFQPGDKTQTGRLAASGRSQKHQQFTVAHLQGDILQHFGRSK